LGFLIRPDSTGIKAALNAPSANIRLK